jgi:hypothetical protein
VGDHTGGERFSDEKIAGLVKFQLAALRKAFAFSQVTRVVYSTCSIHDAENELVVAAVLRDPLGLCGDGDGGSAASGGLAPRPGPFVLRAGLPSWPRRGRAVGGLTRDEAACLVRADPEEDGTHGFFVACFERLPPNVLGRGEGGSNGGGGGSRAEAAAAASSKAAAAGAAAVAAAATAATATASAAGFVSRAETGELATGDKRKRAVDEGGVHVPPGSVADSGAGGAGAAQGMSKEQKAGAKKAEKRRLKRQRHREEKREGGDESSP